MSTFASLTVESPATSPRAGDSLLITGPNTKTTASQKTSKPGFFKRGYNLFFGSGNKASAVGQEDPGSPLSPNEQNCFFDDKSSELDSNGEIDDTWKQRSSSVNFIPELVGIDKLMFVSLILTQNHAIALYNHIPSHLGMQDMKLVYSMANDGSDLHTFYQKSKTLNNTILVIQTVDGAEYGCYCASEWKNTPSYYGSGESFIFSYENNNKINVYKWTGINTFFQYSNNEQIAMGGGGEGFGLLLKDDFDISESLPCETYGNSVSLDIRNTNSTASKVCNVELWTFQLRL